MKRVLKLRLHRGRNNFTAELADLQNIEAENEKYVITSKRTIIDFVGKKFVMGINYQGDLFDILGYPTEILHFKSNEERDAFKDDLIENIHNLLSELTGISKDEIKQKYYKESFYYSNLYFEWSIETCENR